MSHQPALHNRTAERFERPYNDLHGMNAREFAISRGPFLKALAKDAETMSAAAFKRKHGVDVRDCRAKIKRLKELAAAKHENDAEVRELVGTFAAISFRTAG